MKKRYLLVSVALLLSLGLCSCGKENNDDTTVSTTELTTVETTELTTELTTEAIEATTEAVNSTGSTSGADSTTENPGTETGDDLDVVEIVNLKGDVVTVYHLADGDFMDRVSMRYTYDGNGTWTDENGVEYNRVVK